MQLSTYETLTLALIGSGAALYFFGVGISVLLDWRDHRLCSICGTRKIDNPAHYEKGHDFKP